MADLGYTGPLVYFGRKNLHCGPGHPLLALWCRMWFTFPSSFYRYASKFNINRHTNMCLALQAAMPLKDMATSTSTMTLLRFIGGTIGISVGDVSYGLGFSKFVLTLRYRPSMRLDFVIDYRVSRAITLGLWA